jgi:hypothetical protein
VYAQRLKFVFDPSLGNEKFGDFFIAAGPSFSFSLKPSTYSQEQLPYLQDQLSSNGFIDFGIGHHFYKGDFLVALAFRNPTYKTEGFGATQEIKKSSLALEVNKYLVDYSGFAPYVGLNVAYDRLSYEQKIDEQVTKVDVEERFEPGLTIGWDIQPGKASEALILRTNLRWYPLSSFDVDGSTFDFCQLEYNLIQLVFYPGRL